MLQESVDYLVYSVFNVEKESKLGEFLNFFVYDSVKIILLLFLMIMFIGFLRTYMPQKKIKKWLSHARYGVGHFAAALFGAVTPFCSCSSIPIFISFIKAGVPLGITFSFLTTSPIVNEYLVVLMLGFFGWKITAAYVASGLVIGTLTGLVIGRLNLEKHLEKDVTSGVVDDKFVFKSFKSRVGFGFNEALSIVKRLWFWVLVGVGVGAAIHGYIPEETIHAIISAGGVFTVPIAVLIGVPLYANCAALVPIALVLFQKGVPLGTALAFMMATSTLSLPEAVILRRIMRLHLIITFFGIVTAAIIFTGYAFNYLQSLLV
ncbi:MAG: permease [Candidatus Altiarchaeales archaeon]|nr:permease [Candidatus Altiarchaeales archaeon]